jgi:hypothetical protein
VKLNLRDRVIAVLLATAAALCVSTQFSRMSAFQKLLIISQMPIFWQ